MNYAAALKKLEKVLLDQNNLLTEKFEVPNLVDDHKCFLFIKKIRSLYS